VPEERLLEHATGLARRMARLPLNQLQMMKLYANQAAENMGVQSVRTLAILFDGVARHTQEGLDFVKLAQERGFRAAVRQRDDPFGDYGSGSRSRSRSKASKRP
jgi:enoyl-CoA hydratase